MHAAENVLFYTLADSDEGERRARLLVESVQEFGGAMAGCRWLVLTLGEGRADALAELSGVAVEPLVPDPEIDGYILGGKVRACARAEELAVGLVDSLVWMAPSCLVVGPPRMFALEDSVDVAFRVVHHQNVGSAADEPMDRFWAAVYAAAGLRDVGPTIESYVDRVRLRPYVNSHCFSLNPGLGLGARWLELFRGLVRDAGFQAAACADVLHQAFLHQAVLSALLAKLVPWDRIRWLPPAYSYPLDLHMQMPEDRRPRALSDLVCVVYEEALEIVGLTMDQATRSWLSSHE